MIEGVKIKKLKVWPDVPDTPLQSPPSKGGEAGGEGALGFLMEVLRDDEGLLKKFGQSTFTVTYQGTIKAFHWHERQDDLWFAATGKAVVVLYDKRPESASYKQTQVITAGKDDYKLIVIPIGVAHGYKVVSEEPVLMFYHTTESYDPKNPDEKRVAWDDPEIGFNWDKIS